MKQIELIPKSRRKEHGGNVTLGRRRTRRPLDIKQPHHLVLRSDFAYGRRRLTGHRPLINRIIRKAKKRFDIKVYELAIVSNHIHILAKGRTRSGLQNFFRMVAGHTAQEILRQYPIEAKERPRGGAPAQLQNPIAGGAPPTAAAPTGAPTQPLPKQREKENKFWQTRIYSRIVSWGREYLAVKKYVIQNTLEALGTIAYKPRKAPKRNTKARNTS